MKDQKNELFAIEAALEIIRGEQDKEFNLKLSRDTLDNLSGLILIEEVGEREVYTDPTYPNHFSLEDYQERLGPTLLKKFADAVDFGADGSGKMSISLSYRQVNALALASLGRSFEEEIYGKKFWEAVLKGKFDSHRMMAQGRFLHPHVLECVVSFVEVSGRDQYNLHGVFERLSKIGHQNKGAVE